MVRRQIRMQWTVFTSVTRNRIIGNAGRHDVFPVRKYTLFYFHSLAFFTSRIGMGGIHSQKWVILTLAHLPALFLTAVQREDNLGVRTSVFRGNGNDWAMFLKCSSLCGQLCFSLFARGSFKWVETKSFQANKTSSWVSMT